jgi:hypothetical protein
MMTARRLTWIVEVVEKPVFVAACERAKRTSATTRMNVIAIVQRLSQRRARAIRLVEAAVEAQVIPRRVCRYCAYP